MCENGGFSFSGSHLLEACQEIIFGDLSKKANKQVKEKLVILQSIGIIVILTVKLLILVLLYYC